MTLLDRALAVMTAHRVPHALIGAAALAARGVARSTLDIDVLTTDARVLLPAVWATLQDAGTTVDIRRGDAEDPLGGVVRLEQPPERPVDVILGKLAWQTRAVERAEQPAGGAPIVLARDLVLLKLYAGGAQDVWDVRELLQLPGADRLADEVTADLQGHAQAMQDLWAEARQQRER